MLNELNRSDLSKILQASPVGIALSDGKQNISWVNDTFQSYLGISADEINGQNINELPQILKPLFTSSETVHIPANSIRDDQWFMCSQDNLDDKTIHYLTDVGPLQLLLQQRESLKNELREALAIDEVTGMPNKIALFKSLDAQISRSRRYDNLLSIVIMRMNNVEQLNESQSANLLLPVSHMLNDQVRWADMVGKLNDTDFLLVLPETAAKACNTLNDNLTNRLATLPVAKNLPDNFNISASFGYAQYEKGDDLTLLMKKARAMLEKA